MAGNGSILEVFRFWQERSDDGISLVADGPLDLSPKVVDVMKDGLMRYGARAWSSMVVKRLEDDCGTDLRADGFPAELTDLEPEAQGAEVRGRTP